MQPSDQDRIARMEADGILTPSQAALLRESVAPPGAGAEDKPGGPRRRPWPTIAVAGLLILVGLGLLIAAATIGGGPSAVQDVTETLNQPGGHGEMNRTFSILLAAALLLVVPLLIWTWLHNSLVGKEEKVFEAWAQTESNFQRRADLIPALVDTVSRYLRHESETLTGVTQARGEAAQRLSGLVEEIIQAQKDAADILRETGQGVVEDDALLQRLYASQAAVGRGMTSLFGVAEAYPDLRSSDQFLELQAQIEGTENRINVARMRFNDAVRDYNGTVRMLPWSLAAAAGSFQRKAYFRSDEEARDAPDLKLD